VVVHTCNSSTWGLRQEDPKFLASHLKKWKRPDTVALTCNPSYLGVRYQERLQFETSSGKMPVSASSLSTKLGLVVRACHLS
jgi:hypothetical protein